MEALSQRDIDDIIAMATKCNAEQNFRPFFVWLMSFRAEAFNAGWQAAMDPTHPLHVGGA